MGRLFQNFQQGVLPLDTQFLGEKVNFILGFIGTDEHILPHLPDDLHRYIFMLRVLHGDQVRVVPGKDLPAGAAGKAGLVPALAEDRCRQKPGQSPLAGAFGAGDQIKMGNMSRPDGPGQILFQPVVAQQGVKGHGFPPEKMIIA